MSKKTFQLSNFLNCLQLQNLQLGIQPCCPYTHTLRLIRNGVFQDVKELSCHHGNHRSVSKDRNQAQDNTKKQGIKNFLLSSSIFIVLVLRRFQFSQLHKTLANKSSVAKNKIKREIKPHENEQCSCCTDPGLQYHLAHSLNISPF